MATLDALLRAREAAQAARFQQMFSGLLGDGGEVEAPEPDPLEIHLDDLSIDFSTFRGVAAPVRDFLAHYDAPEDGPSTDSVTALTRFLSDVAPSGVPGAFLVSNVAFDANEPEHLRNLLLRPVADGPAAAGFGRGGRRCNAAPR